MCRNAHAILTLSNRGATYAACYVLNEELTVTALSEEAAAISLMEDRQAHNLHVVVRGQLVAVARHLYCKLRRRIGGTAGQVHRRIPVTNQALSPQSAAEHLDQ